MNKNDFLLPLNGLVHGRTRRDLRVGKEFFESFGNTEILDADLMASVETEKSGSYTGVDCHVSGNVQVACDRCLDPVLIPVETDAMLTVKFGDGDDGEMRRMILPAVRWSGLPGKMPCSTWHR